MSRRHPPSDDTTRPPAPRQIDTAELLAKWNRRDWQPMLPRRPGEKAMVDGVLVGFTYAPGCRGVGNVAAEPNAQASEAVLAELRQIRRHMEAVALTSAAPCNSATPRATHDAAPAEAAKPKATKARRRRRRGMLAVKPPMVRALKLSKEGKTLAQIAAALAVSKSTVARWIERARTLENSPRSVRLWTAGDVAWVPDTREGDTA
jgi:hypothetical protein